MVYLSVEISSYNRWPVLMQVLERLTVQTFPLSRFEVIVADDGSSDGTRERILEFAGKARFAMKLVDLNHGGAGATHNSGIRAASGEIVLMIADDVLPTPTLLEEHVRLHLQHPEQAVAVVGRLMQSPAVPRTRFQMAWDPIVNARFPRGRTELDYRDFWVNNLSFKRDFMIRNGMFIPWPAASHEDVELGYRLQQNGMRLLFSEAAIAYHHHPETIDSVARRSYMQGYNWWRFEAKVHEGWVRMRSGRFLPGDGLAARLRFWARLAARTVLFNRHTVPAVAMPLVREAENVRVLAPLVPLFVPKVASYYFRKGIVDQRNGRPALFQ